MSPAHWPRPQWRDGGEAAFLLWFVFGDFADGLEIDAPQYRTRGTPPGIEVVRYRNRALASWEGYPLRGALGEVLLADNPRLQRKARRAAECVMLRGSLADAPDFDALRDLLGSITALLDAGGVAVVDPQILTIFGPAEWRARYFTEDRFAPREHVLILCDEDEANPGRLRVHTRGLRKFARADVDLRNVPSAQAEAAGRLAGEFVDFQARGGCVGEGHEIALEGGTSMRVRLAGGSDDPAFNNRYLALRWPD